MNLPNSLTIARIFLVPLVVAALVQEARTYNILGWEIGNETIGLLIFLVASFTDLLDGYLARRWSQITTLGTLLDPVADKLLISAALIALVEVKAVPAWMVILIIGRDFAISGLRNIASKEGYVIPASDLGKSKMALQVVGVTLLMLGLRWPPFRTWGYWAMWAALAFTLVSAGDYMRHFWTKIDDSIKQRRRRELLELDRLRRRSAAAARREAKREAQSKTASARFSS